MVALNSSVRASASMSCLPARCTPAHSRFTRATICEAAARKSNIVSFDKLSAVAPQSAAVAAPPKTSKPMNIVFVAAEVSPWSKTGGLGDVTNGLPIELAKRGHSVMTIAPRYDQYADAWDTSITTEVLGETVCFFHTRKAGVDRVWIDHPMFLTKVWGKTGAKLYGSKSGADYVDNPKRFRIFCEAAIEAVRQLPFGGGEETVFVANDWHSALVPVLLKDKYQANGEFAKAKAVLCVHNIAFQGRFWPETLKDLDIPAVSLPKFSFMDGNPYVYDETEAVSDEERAATPKSTKKYEKANWLRAGLLSSDKNLTVSPNYALEVCSGPDKGVELNQILSKVGIEGIVNGMDVTEWNPATDKLLEVKYSKDTVVQGKAAAKEALQAEVGLDIDPDLPLFGYIGRLEEQKGVDILLDALPKVLKSTKCQVVILGTGKKAFEKKVEALDKQFESCKGVVKFSAPLAHMITAGVDFLMVPSRFEPCGLIQLHAMQYGTVPVCSSTGGLVDTVKEGVTGFHMGTFDPDEVVQEDVDAIAETMARAAQTVGTPVYTEMSKACIKQDLSWSMPAQKWEGILEEVMSGSAQDTQAGQKKKSEVKVPVNRV